MTEPQLIQLGTIAAYFAERARKVRSRMSQAAGYDTKHEGFRQEWVKMHAWQAAVEAALEALQVNMQAGEFIKAVAERRVAGVEHGRGEDFDLAARGTLDASPRGERTMSTTPLLDKPGQDPDLVETMEYLAGRVAHFRRIAASAKRLWCSASIAAHRERLANDAADRFERRFNAVQRALDAPPGAES